MSATTRASDFPGARVLVITDEDGDTLEVEAYPNGGLVVTATFVGDTASDRTEVPVRIARADRAALLTFLLGGAS